MIQQSETRTQPGLLSVVIPHWNAVRFLPTCLDALAAQTYAPIEVIIADNNSTDGSKELVREQYPWVKLVELDKNYGFTGGCNAGIRAANGEYVALLNNDTEVDPGWAAAIVDAFAGHDDVGSVASKMMLFDQRDRIHATGDFYTIDGLPGNRGVWEVDQGQYAQEDYVFSACAGSSSYRRAMLDQIGLLDDDFFFSCEDVDLGWRAQCAGWRCLYTPHAIVYHHLSASGGGVTASYYTGRNTIYVLVKNYPAELWGKYGAAVLRAQGQIVWEALRAWRGEAARARLRGVLAGIIDIPRMWKKRRAIQAARRVSIEYLESILSQPKR
ncbi:MAG: glycosyltransferase family 2 protein [Anaerolineae bacterium]|nr:glycosyltransferase family 2 protein [Anaerolineae bacterium]